MNVDHSAYFQLQVIEDMVFDSWTIAASEARTQNALLTVVSFQCVQQLLVLSKYLNQRICASKIDSCHEPASHSQHSKRSSSRICHYHFILEARHVLQTAPKLQEMDLQLRVPVATSCPNSLSLASKGRLQTQKARERQSDVSFKQPFLLATLKLGSVSDMVNSFAASQKQQKMLYRQSCSWSKRQQRPSSLPEPTFAYPRNSCRLFCSVMSLLKNKTI